MKFPLRLETVAVGRRSVELFVPDAAAVRQAYEGGEISFPYWSKLWPAGVALANFLERHPQYVSGKEVTELGAGLGLPSLVAAAYAASVCCTDVQPEAVDCVQRSAAHLALKNFTAVVHDWRQASGEINADVLLLSDVNYEPAAFEALTEVIHRFLARGAAVILSTPQRLMAKDFITPLLPYCSKQEEAVVQAMPVTVMALKDYTEVNFKRRCG